MAPLSESQFCETVRNVRVKAQRSTVQAGVPAEARAGAYLGFFLELLHILGEKNNTVPFFGYSFVIDTLF